MRCSLIISKARRSTLVAAVIDAAAAAARTGAIVPIATGLEFAEIKVARVRVAGAASALREIVVGGRVEPIKRATGRGGVALSPLPFASAVVDCVIQQKQLINKRQMCRVEEWGNKLFFFTGETPYS